MASYPYDVALVPEQGLCEKAIQTSKDLQRFGTHFTLAHTEYIPHLSLYMLQLNEEGLERASISLEVIAKETPAIEETVDRYHYENGYLDVEYVKTHELVQLQQKVIELLNPVRDGLREKDEPRLATATGDERANLLQYGYRSIGTCFAPHLTFTRFKDESEQPEYTLPPENAFSGRFVALGIFEMGEHGTCAKKIKEWALSS